MRIVPAGQFAGGTVQPEPEEELEEELDEEEDELEELLEEELEEEEDELEELLDEELEEEGVVEQVVLFKKTIPYPADTSTSFLLSLFTSAISIPEASTLRFSPGVKVPSPFPKSIKVSLRW